LLIESRAGFKVTQVPYRGPAQIMVDVLGGQITMQMGTFFFVAPFITSQRARALAVTSATRMPQTPDVPTVAEQGFPGYQVDSCGGIVAPACVPKPILARLHAELARIYNAPETREQLGKLGMTVRASTPEEFDRHIRAEMALWGKVVRENGLSATQ